MRWRAVVPFREALDRGHHVSKSASLGGGTTGPQGPQLQQIIDLEILFFAPLTIVTKQVISLANLLD